MVINGFLQLYLHPVPPTHTHICPCIHTVALQCSPSCPATVLSSFRHHLRHLSSKLSTSILYFSVLSPSLPLTSQTMTKMKWGRERLLVKGWATTLACRLLLGRSQLITFAISVRFQKMGLQEWPFCCFTF